MVGDLALLGFDLHGFVVAHRSGHQTNHALRSASARTACPIVLRSKRSIGRGSSASNGVIDIAGIMSLLPHRYPFLLVDRVLELDPGRRPSRSKTSASTSHSFAVTGPDSRSCLAC